MQISGIQGLYSTNKNYMVNKTKNTPSFNSRLILVHKEHSNPLFRTLWATLIARLNNLGQETKHLKVSTNLAERGFAEIECAEEHDVHLADLKKKLENLIERLNLKIDLFSKSQRSSQRKPFSELRLPQVEN